MKLLLTSAGLTNSTISAALMDLADIPVDKVHLAFIPTAANVVEGDKGWLIEDYENLKKMRYGCIDIVDISALRIETWLPRLEAANILMVGGGNNYHLMYWLRKSGLDKLLPELLETRVYIGVSAGSMVPSKKLLLTSDRPVMHEDEMIITDDSGLGWFNFYIRPHFNSPYFTSYTADYLEKEAQAIDATIYAIDDQTAVVVANGKEEITGEGEYLIFNNK